MFLRKKLNYFGGKVVKKEVSWIILRGKDKKKPVYL